MDYNNIAVDLEQEIGLSHAPEAEAGVLKWVIRIVIAIL